MPDPADRLSRRLRELAASAGIPLLGCVPPPVLSGETDRWRTWIANGDHAGMSWLGRPAPTRQEPGQLLPGCRSIAVFGFPYHRKPFGGPMRIARFAAGQDYHRVIRRVLEDILAGLRTVAPELQGRVAVDTSPILEKAIAARAGLGWQGKHTCLIHPAFGSYFFLGELFLNHPLPATPQQPGSCGTCRRCIDACPTGALQEPGVLDARRCLAYLTVEHRGVIPNHVRTRMDGNWFGCDRCQEACPHNQTAPDADVRPEFLPDPRLAGIHPIELGALGTREFRRRYGWSSLIRAGLPGLVRNVVALLPELRETPSNEALKGILERFPLAAEQYREFYGGTVISPVVPPESGEATVSG